MENSEKPKKEKMHPLLIVMMVGMILLLALMVFAVVKSFVGGTDTPKIPPTPPSNQSGR